MKPFLPRVRQVGNYNRAFAQKCGPVVDKLIAEGGKSITSASLRKVAERGE